MMRISVHRMRALATVALTVGLAGTLGACGSDEDTPAAGGAAAAAGESVDLAAFMVGLNGYTQVQVDGMRAAAGELGAELTVFDAKFDPATQSAQLQTAIGQDKFDAFVVFPNSGQQVVPRIEQAASKGVKVVCLFSQCGPDVNSVEPQVEGQTGFVGATSSGHGTLLAEQAIGACAGKDPCRVALMQGLSSLPTEVAKTTAFKAAIEREPSIELVAVQDGQLAEQPAYAAAQNVLAANPELDVYASASDQMAFGVARAIDGASEQRDIKVVSLGGGKRAVAAVKEGRFVSTIVTLPLTEGELAATMVIKAARGEQTKTAIDMLTESPVGPVVTSENAARFQSQWTD